MAVLPDDKNISNMLKDIDAGLSRINYNGNWLEEYEKWRALDSNHFDSLLEILNPFSLTDVGNRNIFSSSKPGDVIDLDIICKSVFVSERVQMCLKETFARIKAERSRDKKQTIIKDYFALLDEVFNGLPGCILVLHEFAEKQMVLFGKRMVDFYPCFFSLKNNLRKRSAESLYLLFTYWRITRSENDFENLLSALIDYIQTFFEDYDKDPDMNLFVSLEGKTAIAKLEAIANWLQLIAYHTNGIFEKYKDLQWLHPVDKMADTIIETNHISKHEMNAYRRLLPSDSDETVVNKARCNHGYVIWIKTVDVMYIVRDIFQVLLSMPDSDLVNMRTSKKAVFGGYDRMTKIRDYYAGKVFFHQVYFEHERHYIDSQIIDALEDDAAKMAESIDDVIAFVDAIAGDNIEGLLQAKQRYIKGTSGFITDEQNEKLDALTEKVVEKIKATVQKLDIYNELYRSVSNEFLPYANALMQYPNIFSSLVSAEYLYQQYVEHSAANPNFDYSCISIMYYMSLEDFLNKMVYTPYANNVLSGVAENDLNDSHWKRNESSKYVSSINAFWPFDRTRNVHRLKTTCELGVLGHLFQSANAEDHFKNFVSQRYPGADISRIVSLGTDLINIAPRRNDAAHGGNYLTHADVLTDKGHVYNVSVSQFRGLILELMDIIL